MQQKSKIKPFPCSIKFLQTLYLIPASAWVPGSLSTVIVYGKEFRTWLFFVGTHWGGDWSRHVSVGWGEWKRKWPFFQHLAVVFPCWKNGNAIWAGSVGSAASSSYGARMNPWTRMGREAGPQHNSRGCIFLAPGSVVRQPPASNHAGICLNKDSGAKFFWQFLIIF
jgi:hypothetical protein